MRSTRRPRGCGYPFPCSFSPVVPLPLRPGSTGRPAGLSARWPVVSGETAVPASQDLCTPGVGQGRGWQPQDRWAARQHSRFSGGSESRRRSSAPGGSRCRQQYPVRGTAVPHRMSTGFNYRRLKRFHHELRLGVMDLTARDVPNSVVGEAVDGDTSAEIPLPMRFMPGADRRRWLQRVRFASIRGRKCRARANYAISGGVGRVSRV